MVAGKSILSWNRVLSARETGHSRRRHRISASAGTLSFAEPLRLVRYVSLHGTYIHAVFLSTAVRVSFGARVCYHCRISPPRFLAECRKRRLNQGSFVLLFFRLSTLSDLCLVFACLFSCTVFVLSFCMFIFLYCFVCQYQSSDWLRRQPPKWPILCVGWCVKLCSLTPCRRHIIYIHTYIHTFIYFSNTAKLYKIAQTLCWKDSKA